MTLLGLFVRVALAATLLFGSVLALGLFFSVGVPTAALADDDDDDDDDDDNEDELDEDHEARGQVLEIYPDRVPPELVIANVDGKMTVKVIKTDQLRASGVKLGDHVSVDGEKISEVLFEAYTIDVTRRCCPSPGDNGN
jgi:hypothetical protein